MLTENVTEDKYDLETFKSTHSEKSLGHLYDECNDKKLF
jgi:hypothetical protein